MGRAGLGSEPISSSERGARDRVVKAAFGYRDPLLTYAYAVLRDWERAEDVLQNAYLVVMDKWREADPEHVYPWVRRIVHYKALESARAQRREAPTEEGRLAAAVARSLEEHLDEKRADAQRVMRTALRYCIGRLDSASAGLLAAFYWRNQSCETLAAAQGRSANAVRLLLSRLRGRLRECVRRRLAGSEVER
jgi:RNA polymerase sigma-70 factor (ECF subfamily)